jgi:hypothetical protein
MFLTIRLLIGDLQAIFRAKPNPLVGILGASEERGRTILRVVMQVLISLVVIAVSPLVILDPNQQEGSKRLAWGALGSLVGYWLR